MASKSRKRPRGAAARRPRRRLRVSWLVGGVLAIGAGVALDHLDVIERSLPTEEESLIAGA